jgi:hypothetical protein
MNHFNLENRFTNKSQYLEYKIDLILNQLCTIKRKLSKLAGFEKFQKFENSNKVKMKNQWVVKKKTIYLVARTIIKTMNNNLWYLDSDCSRHMLGDKS